MEPRHSSRIATYVGVTIGLLAYLAWGLFPSLEFGDHLGRFMAGSLLGGLLDDSWIAHAIVWGGTALGVVASLFLFLVCGSVLGSLFGSLLARLSGTPDRPAGPRS